MNTEACKLYSRVFWIFLPNVIEIDPYNFEIYRFKVDAFFLRHSVDQSFPPGLCVHIAFQYCFIVFKLHSSFICFYFLWMCVCLISLKFMLLCYVIFSTIVSVYEWVKQPPRSTQPAMPPGKLMSTGGWMVKLLDCHTSHPAYHALFMLITRGIWSMASFILVTKT